MSDSQTRYCIGVDDGGAFVHTLSRRLARFNWSVVEQDVLKVLYESIIGAETRKNLGEYYTPDWLAHVVVEETVDEPLTQRVLMPLVAQARSFSTRFVATLPRRRRLAWQYGIKSTESRAM